MSNWILHSFPLTFFSQPFIFDNNEFIVVASEYEGGIYKFNIQEKKSIKIFDYEDYLCTPYSTAYDNKNKVLYICNVFEPYEPYQMICDLKTKTIITLNKQDEII